MNIVNYLSLQKIQKYLFGAFLFLTVIAVIVPTYPSFPSKGLDPSWAFAVNQAVAQGLTFGKDFVFTFGPYASIYTKLFHPATDHLMMLGSAFLGICYACLLLILAKGMKFLWLGAFAIFISSFNVQHVMLFFYPLILMLVVYRQTLPSGHINKIDLNVHLKKVFLVFFLPLGLLPLIKGSLIPVSMAAAASSFFLFWVSNQKSLAYSAIYSPIIGLIAFWMASGQQITALPLYFINMSYIISGYAEAMSITGDLKEIILYIITSFCILLSIILKNKDPYLHKLCLFFSYAFFLWISLKAGFIRHDSHAADIAAPFIIISTLLLHTITKEKFLVFCLFLSIFTWGYIIDTIQIKTSMDRIFNNAQNTYDNFWKGIQIRVHGNQMLRNNFLKQVNEIHKEMPIPKLFGTSDIYAYQQSYLLSSANVYSPRPIPQSYSVYTPELLKINENHILGKKAPDNIIFQLETIDNRLPTLDDGLSWIALIRRYYAERIFNNLILLKKKDLISTKLSEVEIYNGEHRIGEKLLLPNSKDPLFAEIQITQTLIGKALSIIFKPTELHIRVEFIDGKRIKYRFIANMGKSKFLISPLVENNNDFFHLTKSDLNSLKSKIVSSIQIKGKKTIWGEKYKLKLFKVDFSPIAIETTSVYDPHSL